MMNISIIVIMMLTIVIGGIANINAITPNTTITNEDDGSINKSEFDWGPINGPEPGTTLPPPEDANNNNIQPDTASPFYKEQVTEDGKKESQKEACEDQDGKWTKDGECKFKNDN